MLHEFERYPLDILGLSKVRWTGSGRQRQEDHTLHITDHIKGVGLLLLERAAAALASWRPGSERLIVARFISAHAKTTVIIVYAPTEDADDVYKDAFYDERQTVLDEVTSSHSWATSMHRLDLIEMALSRLLARMDLPQTPTTMACD